MWHPSEEHHLGVFSRKRVLFSFTVSSWGAALLKTFVAVFFEQPRNDLPLGFSNWKLKDTGKRELVAPQGTGVVALLLTKAWNVYNHQKQFLQAPCLQNLQLQFLFASGTTGIMRHGFDVANWQSQTLWPALDILLLS